MTDDNVIPLRPAETCSVEVRIGDGAWVETAKFAQAQAANEYLAGAVGQAARPTKGGWMAGRIRWRLREGKRIAVEVAIDVSYPRHEDATPA